MTDPTTGLLLLPARSYDPTQGRFTSRDTANVFNKYQGFSTNPIINVDPTGHFSLEDLLLDIGMAIVFAVAAVATAGAAVAALPALVAGEAAAVTTTAIVTTVATAVTAVASATGAVASAIKAADDIDDAVTGKHFLTTDQRNALSTVQAVAGAVSAASGLTAMGGTLIGIDTAAEATQDAADFLPETADDDDDTDVTDDDADTPVHVYKPPNNIDPGSSDSESSSEDEEPETPIVRYMKPKVWDDVTGQAVWGGWEDESEAETSEASESDLEDVFGSLEESDTDEAIVDESPAVKDLHQSQQSGREPGPVHQGRDHAIDPNVAAPDRDERQLRSGGRRVRRRVEHVRPTLDGRRRRPPHRPIRAVPVLVRRLAAEQISGRAPRKRAAL